jgi:predicted transcriptional regulator
MRDTHLSVRISDELAASLERLAEARGTPRSGLVREAVAQYVVSGAPRADAPQLLARDFKRAWEALPHLAPEEAAALDTDIRQARSTLLPPDDPWA